MSETNDRIENLSPLKRALIELRDLRARLDQVEQARHEPIAIVGMALRFPGSATDPEQFWEILRNGIDTIEPIPTSRWSIEQYYDEDPTAPGKMYTRYGAFVEGIDQFDPHFFGISPREAEMMDPQQRLLLETAWEALERAGIAPAGLKGSQTGVFVGIANSDYFRMLARDTDAIDVYFGTGNTLSVAAGRISYLLGLHGPSMSIDTACSSSLTALHLAVQSLRAGESDLALAGGVNLILTPEININFSKAQMMARDGRCKTFDATADGYVRGEGCAVVTLKRFSDALADNDNILALVRGTAINQDGRSSGLTAPNGPAQEAVIRLALEDAGVEAGAIGYVETHGTGTALGDPIEVKALGNTLAAGRAPDQPLLIGSVKTNIGHLEAVAGLAGLIKATLALQHGQIPPNLHFREPNPYIPWDKLAIDVPTSLTPWPTNDGSRLAAVSSFGFSGTNAHAILEAAPVPEPQKTDPERPLHLLVLSARSTTALHSLVGRYDQWLAQRPQLDPADICFTAGSGRSHFSHRLAIQAADIGTMRTRLRHALENSEDPYINSGVTTAVPEVALLFTGHGKIYQGMGSELYATQPVFREALDQCAGMLEGQIDRNLLEILGIKDSGTTGLLEQMAYAQPALFALQYALGALWHSWGLAPAWVVGHSAGEYAAACFAGVFSLADGLRMVVARGRLMQSLAPGGAMVSLLADEPTVREAIAPFSATVTIAAHNAPQSVVVSGPATDVEAAIAPLQARGIETRRLDISIAAHSPLIDPILDAFSAVVQTVQFAPPQIGLISTLTGQPADAEITTPDYWRRHLREPVRFAEAMQVLYDQGCSVFVEAGPHPTLLGIGRNCLPEGYGHWLPSLRQGQAEWEQILSSLAELYTTGFPIDWSSFDRPYQRRRVDLPTYPFEHQPYWAESARPVPTHVAAETRWHQVQAATRRQAAQGPLDLGLEGLPKTWDRLNQLATAAIGQAFIDLGFFRQAGDQASIAEMMERTTIAPTYAHLIQRWIDHLVTDGILAQAGDTIVAHHALKPDLATARAEVAEILANATPLRDYVLRCSEQLAAVVSGAESPLETLFPGGSYATTDFIYHEWSVARYFNAIVRTAVEAILLNHSIARPLHILEIGAGTGGTTATVLPALPDGRVIYSFTDVSDFFLDNARERFADHTFVRYNLLDIAQPPQHQGFPLHSVDVIVAANVLHATSNLDQTLTHVRELLVPGGILLLYETTDHPRWFDITTGLIEGWQLFEDNWRDDNPLIDPKRWADALEAAGFVAVNATPERGTPTELLGQHVVAALAPFEGIERNPFAPSTETTLAAAPRTTIEPEPIMTQLAAALPADRHELLVDFVRGHLRRVLKLDPARTIDRNARLMDMGVDSLMAVELRNRLSSSLQLPRKLPATLIFDYPTAATIASMLDEILQPDQAAATHAETNTTQTEPATTDVSELSDAEVEALLLKKLDQLS
jgi:acyl transferase domain-containing protein/SAM-dependent methyltransferase